MKKIAVRYGKISRDEYNSTKSLPFLQFYF